MLACIAKTLQYVVLMVVFILFSTSGGIWVRWIFSYTQINTVHLHHYSYPPLIVHYVSSKFYGSRVLTQFC